jgi:hypothetical protein
MERNVGKYDKAIRIGLGASLIIMGLPFAGGGFANWLKIVFLVVGAVLLLTGIIGFCPIYKVLGMSTNKVSDTDMKDLMK